MRPYGKMWYATARPAVRPRAAFARTELNSWYWPLALTDQCGSMR